jgi:hypothetical protein
MNILYIVLGVIALIVVGIFALRAFESMKGFSNDQLRAMLRSPNWLFYRNALLELRRRGEDIKLEVMPILNLLISDVKKERMGGWMIFGEFYPDLAARVPDYKPAETPDVCKEKMQKMFMQATVTNN